MKKKSVLAIAIIAIVAVVASVSFAAWNAIVASKDIVEIEVADRVNIGVEYTAADVTGKKLAPVDGSGSTVIIPEGSNVERTITLGTFTANFTGKDGVVTVASHEISVALSEFNENLKYTLTPKEGATATEVILSSADAEAKIIAGVEYTITVSFVADAGTITEANAAAVANGKFGATLTFDAVKK